MYKRNPSKNTHVLIIAGNIPTVIKIFTIMSFQEEWKLPIVTKSAIRIKIVEY